MSSFKATFTTDGSGDFEIQIPADNDMHDVLALAPVISSIREYLAPTVDLRRQAEPPDLIA